MVKVAFIVEGKIEKIFIDFLNKSGWLEKYNIKKIAPTIDAKGGGNLCPPNMQVFVDEVKTYNPDRIVILTDLECDPCIEKTKERLGNCDTCTIILAKKAIEAWFLAEDNIIAQYSNGKIKHFEFPEDTEDMPYDTFKEILIEHTGRGIRKTKLATSIFRNGFDIEKSASHPNCQSAKYFVDKIKALGK
jgi:hypothetical protein